MDEFLVKIKENTEKKKIHSNNDNILRLKKILQYFLTSNPHVKISPCNDSGNVFFSISLSELKIPFTTFVECQNELFCDYVANFLGEVFIRDNIEEFTKVLTDILPDRYNNIVNKLNHMGFGLQFCNNKLIFSFHVSLLQKILTEDFKKKVNGLNV